MKITCGDPNGYSIRGDTIREQSALILGSLPQSTISLLNSIDRPAPDPVVRNAGLVLHLCRLYNECWTCDRTIEHCTRSRLFPGVTRTELLDRLIRPVRLNFLTCSFGIDEYWNIPLIAFDVLQHHLELSLLAGTSPQALHVELECVWNVVDAREMLLGEAIRRVTLRSPPELIRPDTPDEEYFVSLVDIAEPLVERRLQSQSRASLDRSGLLGIASDIHLASILPQIAPRYADDRVAEYVNNRVRGFCREIEPWMKGLGAAETRLFMSEDPKIQMMKNCLTATPVIQLNRAGEIGPPTEVIDGKVLPPGWLIDFVFSMSGRLAHQSLGPIAYFYIVFEPHELQQHPDKIGLSVDVTSEELQVIVYIDDIENDPLASGFHFLLSSAKHLQEASH